MREYLVTFHGAEDKLGRRPFTFEWEDPEGGWRPEPHPGDGEPVGYRRGQVFFAVPGPYLERLRASGRVRIVDDGRPRKAVAP